MFEIKTKNENINIRCICRCTSNNSWFYKPVSEWKFYFSFFFSSIRIVMTLHLSFYSLDNRLKLYDEWTQIPFVWYAVLWEHYRIVQLERKTANRWSIYVEYKLIIDLHISIDIYFYYIFCFMFFGRVREYPIQHIHCRHIYIIWNS